MSAAPLEPSSKESADDILSQPESQHGKHICNAVLKRPSGTLQSFLKQAVTELSGWGKATAASFLPEPMPLLEQSVDLQSSLQHNLIEQAPVSITPLFLRVFDMHASKQTDNPFLKAHSVMSCALATGVQPGLPYKVELGLEEAPPKQKAQPFVSNATPRRTPRGPSINDTFSLGRKSLGPDLDRNANKPIVHRSSLQQLTRRRRSSVATRRMSRMKIDDEEALGVEEDNVEEEDFERPEGLTDAQWEAQLKTRKKTKDIDKVRNRLNELKRRQERRDQEKHRPMEESNEENVVCANDTFYERNKRRQEIEEKRREQANEALRKKKDVQRNRLESKKRRIEKRLKLAKKKGQNDMSDDEVEEVDSEQEDNQNDQATHIHEETDQQTDSPGSKRQRLGTHDTDSHSNNDGPHQSQNNHDHSGGYVGRHQYGYASHSEVGGQRPLDHHMYPVRRAYQDASYPPHLSSDRQMLDDRGSYDRPPYPPGSNHARHGTRLPYYDSRPPHDFPPDHPGREPSFHRNPEYHPSISPERNYENGGGMHNHRPATHPMNYLPPPNDVQFHRPMLPPRGYHDRPPQHGPGDHYYNQDQPPRSYTERNYEPEPYERGPHDRRMPRDNPNSPPTRYPHPPLRPPSEYHQEDSSYRR